MSIALFYWLYSKALKIYLVKILISYYLYQLAKKEKDELLKDDVRRCGVTEELRQN